jgi:hypothetical protein
VKFVGHIIDADGIRADPVKIQAIKNMHVMKVVSGLLSSDNEACQKLEFESILLKILAPVNCPSV